MEWMNNAPCKKLHSDFFFPPLDATSPNHYYAVGKYVCHSCPVWKDCLAYCDLNSEVWGLWGGLSPQDRKRRANLPHGSIESYRAGCSCSECATTENPNDYDRDLSSIPKVGEEFDLLSVVFDITR